MNINIDIKWYQWLSGIIFLLLSVFLLQNLIGSVNEGQGQAWWTITWITAIPLIISLYFTFGFRWTLKKIRKD